ncbi:MAG: sugar ABC transporter permease [Clostridia bacterium]|nr:sugar ABC transporter permease [Clostridia bacterium]
MKKLTSLLFKPFSWILHLIGDLFYALKVAVHSAFRKKFPKKPSTLKKDKVKDYIFYIALMVFPLAMFVLTKIVISGQAILLGFQEFDATTDEFLRIGLKNFNDLFAYLGQDRIKEMFRLSMISWTSSMILCNIVPITFSFYVYKKFLGHSVFKVLLFLPNLFSSMITVSLFKMICNRVIPELFGIEALITLSADTTFGALLFYNLWSGLGSGLLTHLAVMNAIDPSISESAQLDGVGFYGELWHIVLPSCYRVITLGLVTSFAGIFTGSLGLFAFVGKAEPRAATLPGHHFYLKTLDATTDADYAFLSAWGLFITAICTPLTLILRHVINKYGPSEE